MGRSAIYSPHSLTLYSYRAIRLTSYSQGSASARYAYNGDGLRVAKTVNGATTSDVRDLAEGMPLLLQETTNSTTTKYVTGDGGLPIEQQVGSSPPQYYVQDHLGSTRALLNSDGSTAATFTFDPYGKKTGSTGAATTPFGFAGQYTDSESGLQYLRARYYDPSTEQFLTIDPLQSVTTLTKWCSSPTVAASDFDGSSNPVGRSLTWTCRV